MGAAAGFGAMACILALTEGVPPTINLTTLDPAINMDVVANTFRQADIKIAVNHSFAFGGNNAITVFGRYEHDQA